MTSDVAVSPDQSGTPEWVRITCEVAARVLAIFTVLLGLVYVAFAANFLRESVHVGSALFVAVPFILLALTMLVLSAYAWDLSLDARRGVWFIWLTLTIAAFLTASQRAHTPPWAWGIIVTTFVVTVVASPAVWPRPEHTAAEPEPALAEV